jgi:hypothetical protein
VGWVAAMPQSSSETTQNSYFFHKHRWAFGESGMLEILYGRRLVERYLQPAISPVQHATAQPSSPTRCLATSSSRQTSPGTIVHRLRTWPPACCCGGSFRILLHHSYCRASLSSASLPPRAQARSSPLITCFFRVSGPKRPRS